MGVFFSGACGMTTQQVLSEGGDEPLTQAMTSHDVMASSRFGAAGPPRHLQADTPVTWVTKNFK